jgi:predicted aldo/keto reductase-like oxidoreductase
MEKAKKDGRVRFVGVSTHRNEPEVIQACTDSKFYDFVMPAYNFKQKHYVEVRESIARAAQAGLAIVAMKVMGGTGAISDILRPVNASAALKWVLQDPNVHTIVCGFTTFDQMNIDLAVMEDLSIKDSEKDYLQKKASIPGFYCQGCGQCEKQCLAKLPIPDLMRAYMYCYGYRKPGMAQELVVSLGLPSHACEDCGTCPVKCSIGFNVPRKIRDVARLRDVPTEFIA